jgi:transketolase
MLHLTKVKAVNPAYEALGQLSVKLDDLPPLKQLQTKFGFTPEAVVGTAKARLAASAAG